MFTLTPEVQVAPDLLPRLLEALDGTDLVVARRLFEEPPRRRKFDQAVNALFGTSLHDIRCGVRAMRAEVAKELTIYGNQHRFLPLLAQAQGFSVREIDLPAVRAGNRAPRTRGLDASLLLDVITVYFLLRFLKKPFRFFGGFGFAVLAVGALFTAWLVISRLFFGVPLVDRPALVLTTLMVVLGIQIISVGLIGEIVAFTYAKDIKDYRVDRVVEPPEDEDGEPPSFQPERDTRGLNPAAAVVLTRELIQGGWIQQLVAGGDAAVRVLSEEELRSSQQAMLVGHPAGQDLAVFAYGSLIWNPCFHFAGREVAHIHGFHRRFCLWTHLGRGTRRASGPDAGARHRRFLPGRALLHRCGQHRERARHRLAARDGDAAYRPAWVTAQTAAGPRRALAFLINHGHPRYAGRLDEAAIVAAIATARGPLGSCSDYLFNTTAHLDELGIVDRSLRRLGRLVRAAQDELEPPE